MARSDSFPSAVEGVGGEVARLVQCPCELAKSFEYCRAGLLVRWLARPLHDGVHPANWTTMTGTEGGLFAELVGGHPLISLIRPSANEMITARLIGHT